MSARVNRRLHRQVRLRPAADSRGMQWHADETAAAWQRNAAHHPAMHHRPTLLHIKASATTAAAATRGLQQLSPQLG